MFGLVEVACGAGLVPHVNLGAHVVLQKIHWNKFELDQGRAYERKLRFPSIWWHILV